MKGFFMTIVLVVSGFLGLNKNTVVIVPTPVLTNIPTQVEMIIIEPTRISTPSVVIKKITPMPTKIVSLKTSLTEEILKSVFGFTEVAHINQVLNDPDQVKKYENEYYQKFKNYPMLKLKITDVKKQYVMPSKNGPMVCTGAQLNSLYEENTKTEKEVEYQKMNTKCHYGKEQETGECQEWRRVNDPSKKDKPSESVGIAFGKMMRSMQDVSKNYDSLIEKFCK